MLIKNWKKDIFTVPNVLSLFRLALIPLYVSIYLTAKERMDYYIASIILAVSCLTDMIDGQIARRFNMISAFGKFLDPLADKLTQFTLMICLCIKHHVLIALVVLVFCKEVFQLVAAYIHFRKGQMLNGAQISGKICTTVLFISLIVLVMIPDISQKAVNWIAIVDAVFLLIAFADYIRLFSSKNTKYISVNNHKED